jgi:hypothetical protein
MIIIAVSFLEIRVADLELLNYCMEACVASLEWSRY